jgi:hypothetical protein
VSLLKLYQTELGDLLDARDVRIACLLQGRSKDEVLDDRALYELACRPIDLTAKLTSQLTGESSHAARPHGDAQCLCATRLETAHR